MGKYCVYKVEFLDETGKTIAKIRIEATSAEDAETNACFRLENLANVGMKEAIDTLDEYTTCRVTKENKEANVDQD